MSAPGDAPAAPVVPAFAKVQSPLVFGNPGSFWVEYPSGLVDLTRPSSNRPDGSTNISAAKESDPPALDTKSQFELHVEDDRVLRLNKSTTAIVIIDMQKFVIYFPPFFRGLYIWQKRRLKKSMIVSDITKPT